MSRTAEVRLFFGEGTFDFALRIGELVILEEMTGEGASETHRRLASHRWRVRDLQEPLRLGLIGAGMDRQQAHTLVERHCAPGYLADSVMIAMAVIAAAIYGVEAEPVGELSGEAARQAPSSPAAEPGGRTSTASAGSSGSVPAKSARARSGNSRRSSTAGGASTSLRTKPKP